MKQLLSHRWTMWYANSKQFGKILTEIKNSSNIFTFIGPFMLITCLETNFFFLERYPASKTAARIESSPFYHEDYSSIRIILITTVTQF